MGIPRNDILNPRCYFTEATSKKPVLRQNQFGIAAGGPIVIPHRYDGRNRTFFFAEYEGSRIRAQTVSSDATRTYASRRFQSHPSAARRIPDAGVDTVASTDAQGQAEFSV